MGCCAARSKETLQNARYIALWTTVIVFLLSLYAWAKFDPAKPGFQLVEQSNWFSNVILYKLGVDGMSMPFVLLTTFLMPLCILASWHSIQTRVKSISDRLPDPRDAYDRRVQALDLLLFYVFFEGGLIPMFLIIGMWGGKRRVYAAFKFFLYTLAGSLLMLLGVMAMYWTARHDATSKCCCIRASRRTCRTGCGWPSSPPSR